MESERVLTVAPIWAKDSPRPNLNPTVLLRERVPMQVSRTSPTPLRRHWDGERGGEGSNQIR